MANWEFERWITDTATAEYKRLQAIAEAAVSGEEGPLPLNCDPRLGSRLAVVNHYERTRNILRSIVKPQDVGLDMSLLGVFHFVKYRTELGTCVYFARIVNPPNSPLVLVYGFAESPLDYDAIRKIIVSGNVQILQRLNLPLPQTGHVSLTIH